MNQILLLSFGLLVCFSLSYSSPIIVCYHENWTHWRKGTGKFPVERIDNTVCTHYVYAYYKIEGNEVKQADSYLQGDLKDLQKFAKKVRNAKSMVAIGGIPGSTWSSMAAWETSRTTFVNSVVKLLQDNGLDGVMIDWRWPGDTSLGGSSSDKANFVSLLDDLKKAFASKYILGITGPGTKGPFDAGIDGKKIMEKVDFVHVLSFDYHGSWEKKVHYCAPLHHSTDRNKDGWPQSAGASLAYWLNHGNATKDKLLLSVPGFGHSWILAKEEDNEPGDEATSGGPKGPSSDTEGYMTYKEICEEIKSNPTGWHSVRDQKNAALYAYKNKLWLSFDDSQIAQTKAEYVKKNNFGGVVFYGIGGDDFEGKCTGVKFPLLRAVNRGLGRTISTGTVTEKPTGPKPATFECKSVGTFKDTSDCRKYHKCVKNELGVFEDTAFFCEKNYAFDQTSGTCKPKAQVTGCEND